MLTASSNAKKSAPNRSSSRALSLFPVALQSFSHFWNAFCATPNKLWTLPIPRLSRNASCRFSVIR